MDGFIKFLSNLDRRILFVIVGLAVAVPLVWPLDLPIVPSPNSRAVYKALDEIPDGGRVLLSFDYDPASAPELQPMAEMFMRHCFRKNLRVLAIALWPQGVTIAKDTFERLRKDDSGLAEYGEKKYGVDFINLGYHPNPFSVLKQMGVDFQGAVTLDDVEKKPLSEFAITKDVRTYKDVGIIVSLTSGDIGVTTYIKVANSQFGVKVTGGCTAVTALELYPYIQSRQLTGLLEGMKGAAEYEEMVWNKYGSDAKARQMLQAKGVKRPASQAMVPQNVVHIVIILFILVANFAYFMETQAARR